MKTLREYSLLIFEKWAHPEMSANKGRNNQLGYILFLNSGVWLLVAVPFLTAFFYIAGYVTGYITAVMIAGTTLFSLLCLRLRRSSAPGVYVSVFSSGLVTFIYCYTSGGIYSPFVACIPLMAVPSIFMGKQKVYMFMIYVAILIICLLVLPYKESLLIHSIDESYKVAFISLYLVIILPYYFLIFLAKIDLESLLRRIIKKKQNQLLRHEKMATLGHLTAGVAHEINNPLNFVTGNAQAMELDIAELSTLVDEIGDDSVSLNEEKLSTINELLTEMKTLVKGMSNGGDRIEKIVKLLRTYTESSDTIKEESLSPLIDKALVRLSDVISSKKIMIDRTGDNEIVINCEANKIVEVLYNIMDNAVYASASNSDIRIHTSIEEGGIVIQIQDFGVGISQEDKKNIFDPFFTKKEVGAGQGLGLFMSYQIVKEHGGDIIVESELGSGATFSIYLPVV